MKNILILFLTILVASCSFFSKEKIEVTIINNSESSITNLEFFSCGDSYSFFVDEIKPGESYSETLDFKFENKYYNSQSWSIKYKTLKKDESSGCIDNLDVKKKRKLRLEFTNEKMNVDYNGSCF